LLRVLRFSTYTPTTFLTTYYYNYYEGDGQKEREEVGGRREEGRGWRRGRVEGGDARPMAEEESKIGEVKTHLAERGGAERSEGKGGGVKEGGVKTMREEYAKIIEAKLAIDSLVEEALKAWANFNPLDRLKDYLTSDDEAIKKTAMEKIQSQVTRHIDMFSDMLEEGKEIPVELLRKAMEVSSSLRRK